MKKIVFTASILIASLLGKTQNIGINTSGAIPDPSAALDVDFTNKGLLIPRVSLTSTADVITIPSPATSLLVYNNNPAMTGGAVGFWYFDGTVWVQAVGPQGPVGPAGAAGAVGPQGPIGPQGPSWTLSIPSYNANGNVVVNGTAGSGGPVTSTQAAWLTTGNAGIAAANFIGPTNSADLKFRTNNLERMTIEANGYIGLNGVTAPACPVQFSAGNSGGIWLTQWDHTGNSDAPSRWQNTAAANGNRTVLGTTNYNGNAWAANGIMGLALNAAGTAAGVEGFSNSNDGYGVLGGFVGGTSMAANGWAVYADGWAGGLTAWQNVSDQRLKKGITKIDGALNKIMELRGVEYYFDNSNFPGLHFDTQSKQIGFIAQEVERVFPNIVREANLYTSESVKDAGINAKQNTYKVKSLSYSLIVPVLVEAMKEQQAIINALEKRIEALENK